MAVGAPKAADAAVISEQCLACDEPTDRESHTAGDTVVLTCAACGAETDRFGPGPEG